MTSNEPETTAESSFHAGPELDWPLTHAAGRSEEHTSELHHRCISYAVFCLKKKNRATRYLPCVRREVGPRPQLPPRPRRLLVSTPGRTPLHTSALRRRLRHPIYTSLPRSLSS